jgi:site-specific recombinase XerD
LRGAVTTLSTEENSMMTDWYQTSLNTLQLNGKAERTQEAYTRAVRMLSAFYGKSPDEITEPELEAYFLRRRNVDHWSPNTMRICYCGIRFFFVHVLQRNWHLFDILRAKSEARLPAILSREEVRGILRFGRTPRNHAFLSTVYACGLRLQEAQHLEVSDIDSQRMMIHVHRGKGAKDRFVPLPRATLTILRAHWRNHRNPRLLFPACGRDGRSAATATTPMAKSSMQGAFRHAKRDAGVAKRGVSVPTLRHCYATPLLEAGVNPRVIQRHMGHASLESTRLYLHLTHKGTEDAYAALDQVMEGL